MLRNIFISYRREENKYQARMMFDAFQKAAVHAFYDIDSIPLGRDFKEIIMSQVHKCDVLLALVGPSWATCLDPKTGLRRLENTDDFVRIEIGTALNRGIPVVPVLLDDAPMPETDQLPNDLLNLFNRQAEYISFRTFDADVSRLITKLKIESEQQPEQPQVTSSEVPLGVAGFMAEIPQRTVGTPTKISEWVQRQAATWFSVLKNPREFLAGTDIDSPKALGDSIQFLFFVLVCMRVLKAPLDAISWHIGIFDLTYFITDTVTTLLSILVFCFAIHLSAKAMRGKGSVSRTMTSLFYAAGLTPILLFATYIEQSYPPAREMYRSGNFDWQAHKADPVVMVLITAVEIVLVVYIVTKLVPAVKFVFSIGTIRALIAVGVGGISYLTYEYYVSMSLFVEQLKGLK